MRLCQFRLRNEPVKTDRVGAFIDDNRILDFKTVDETSPSTLIEILQQRPELLNIDVSKYASKFDQDLITLEDVKLLPPISGSDKVICVGMNYTDHCLEQNVPVPEEPIFFSKFGSCLIGPYSTIPYPEMTNELDWEVELAVVIKKKGKNIPKHESWDYILGYTVAHDVSARDWQLKKNGGQWLIGKAMDGFCPIGPWIATPMEIKDPHNLDIKCRVNGETKQDSNTRNLVHQVDSVVSRLSQFMTLRPGDIILTGTPPGVGVFAEPPCFLKPGDVVECEIEQIGTIRNTIGERKQVGEMFCDF